MGVPQNTQDKNSYKFTMRQEIPKGAKIITSYTAFIDNWNSQLLNPQWSYLDGLISPIYDAAQAYFSMTKQIKTPTEQLQKTHALYIAGWESIIKSLNSLKAHIIEKGANSQRLIDANTSKDEALIFFEKFNAAFRDL